MFLWLPSSQIALERVAKRVAAGGHSVPEETVARRYRAGLLNMHAEYLPMADAAAIYDNAGDKPILVAERASGVGLTVHDADRWQLIERASR